MRCHFIHDRLPCAPGHCVVVSCKVGASEAKIEGWLSVRFVHRIQEPSGFGAVSGAQCSLFSRFVVRPGENAVTSAIESVFELHASLHGDENERAEFFVLASSGGVGANCPFAGRSAGKSAGLFC